jgi:hypothetical protein
MGLAGTGQSDFYHGRYSPFCFDEL